MTCDGDRLTVRRTDEVSETATVRHVDQLSETTLNAFVEMADGGSERVAGVDPGDVIVFTSYLEVVHAERARETGPGEQRVDAGPVG